MADTSKTHCECPFCREEIREGAVVCKHCRSRITAASPDHGGTCPFCREDIKPGATKCKHCQSMLTTDADCGCGCGCGCGGAGHDPASNAAFLSGTPLSTMAARAPSFIEKSPGAPRPGDIVLSPPDPCMKTSECFYVCFPGLGCRRICIETCEMV
ncbi:double zinc ribbon domain-containing protein [Tropicibacter sp. S64]|uniref:double zinc ribbon domain-containing protein n=1 Tax=Tropicibacter sp. S64 TaxID=3415122 RepID=UPI003C7A9729